jgi:hypothetical protein
MKSSIGCLLAVMFIGLFCPTGCAPTLAHSTKDRQINYRQNMETDFKTMQQDIDLWLMMDRPTRLTRWRVN